MITRLGAASAPPSARAGSPASVRLGVVQLLHALADLDRLAQRFHPDPGGLAARLRLQFLQPRRDGVERGDAAVVDGVRLLEALGEVADRPLAFDHHRRQRGEVGLVGGDRAGLDQALRFERRVALAERRGMPFEAGDVGVAGGDGGVDFGAAVAESAHLKLVMGATVERALGRNFRLRPMLLRRRRRRRALRARRGPARGAAPRARGPRAGSGRALPA